MMPNKPLEERVAELEKWKLHCNIVTAGLGGIWMTITTAAGLVYSYWEDIKHYFAGLK